MLMNKLRKSNDCDQRKSVPCISFPLSIVLAMLLSLTKISAQTPNVVSTSPGYNQIASSNPPKIQVTFNTPMDSTTFTRISFAVFGERSGYGNGTISYDSIGKRVSFTPYGAFGAGERITATLSRKIKSYGGDSLRGFTWTFRIPSRSVPVNFSTPVAYGGGGQGMKCVDMNNDGSPDIVTSSGIVLLNNGKGQFNSSWVLPNANSFQEIAVDDFNRDGFMDVIYGGSDGLKIALGDGAGNFAISTKPFWFYSFITADLNNDGYPDIAGMNRINGGNPPYSDTTSYWAISFNNGAGQFADTMRVGSFSGWFRKMIAADIDNDGTSDIAIISQHAVNPTGTHGLEGLIVFRNNGAGIFAQMDTYPAGRYFDISFPEFINSADFNNDGFTDFAVMADFSGTILLNSTGGIFTNDSANTRSFWGAEQISPFTCGDINGDGWIDIAKSGYTPPFEITPRYFAIISNCSSTFLNCGSGHLFRYTLPNALIEVVAAVDLDGDGDIDLVHAGEGVFISLNRDTTASVARDSRQPKGFSINQNYPNPFNGATTVSFRLLERQKIVMTIFSLLGEQVRTLEDNVMPAGESKVVWNGSDDNAVGMPSGMYFIRMQTNNSVQFIKAILIK